ncbi:MAG: Uma2 family endonuclease [Cyclobacteriaceae bacterium]
MITSLSELDLSKSYTYADYLTWQFDEMVEVIKGKVFKMSLAPLPSHQLVAGKLHLRMGHFFEDEPCQLFIAPFDVRLPTKSVKDEDIVTVFQPDLCVICDLEKIDRRGCLGAPDLVVEILSKSTAEKDLKVKYQLYEEAGVSEYWIVEPEYRKIDQYQLKEASYQLVKSYTQSDTISSALFPALSISVADIFKEADLLDR